MKPKHNSEPQKSSGARGYIAIAVIFTLAAGAVWFSINRENIAEYTDTYKNREAEITEIADLKQRISQLKRKQQSLAFNGVESEKQIRERLQMHKPGERVIYLEDEGEQTSATSATQETAPVASPLKDELQPDKQKSQDASRKPGTDGGTKKPSNIKSIYDTM